MNLNAFYIAVYKPWLLKLSLVMKLTTLFILLALMQCSATGFSQNINLNEHNAPLRKVLQQINKQTGYVFFYDSKDIANKRLTIELKNATVEDALRTCLKDQLLSYKIIDKTIVLQQIEEPVINSITKQVVPPIKISGRLTDEKNEPLPGVTVKVKGGKEITVSDIDGNFSISVADERAVLVFSYIGFVTKELPVTPGAAMIVKLEAEVGGLNEVVVVGYGSQKKVNLTGSVATVSGEEINKRTAPNAANLLQGKVTGLDVVQSTGQPGKDAPNLQVRGLGSFGASSAPLVLVDGVIGDFNFLSPNDIESISVLKDAASSAIYGNRAANGVILVTTKRGKAGATAITYSNNFSLNQPSRLPDLIWNSVEYMEAFNAARIHSNQLPVYTQEQIDLYRNAPAGSKEYPNFNYVDHYINNSFSQNHNLGISGGSENTTFNISSGYLQQNGIIKNTDAKRYTFLLSLDSKLNKTFKVGGTVNFTKQDIVEPWLNNSDLVLLIYQSAPTYSPFLPDGSGRIANNDFIPQGTFGAGHNRSPEFTINTGNYTTNNYQARAQGYIETKITNNLTWLVKGAFNYNDQFIRNYQYAGAEYYFHPDPVTGAYRQSDNGNPTQVGVSNRDQRELYVNAYTTLNYNTTFKKAHTLNVLGGYSVESDYVQFLYGQRSIFPVTTLTELGAGSTTGQNLDGNRTEYALLAYFGRVNYDYKGKYLLELNGRYDGSSRISPEKRYGFFPSVSAGWRISQENFMKALPAIDNLKLRASYGRLGNQAIGNYAYQDILTVNTNTDYSFTTSGTDQGVRQSRLTDRNIQWETTDVTDVGLDVDIKNGLFGATVDYYNKKTTGILTQPNVLYAIGLQAPTTNFGSLQNRGFEFNLSHANHIGKNFRYSANVLLSINRNKVLKINREDRGDFVNEVGHPYYSFYMVKWIGIFQSQEEINNSPLHQFNPKPGDLKFADTNGDNKIDQNDRVIIDGMYPDYTYSFNLNIGYKNFDLTTFWQGVQGIKRYLNAWGFDPFIQGSTPPTFFRNAWTPENRSQTVPALYTFGYGPVNGTSSTYGLRDASYLRLKNVQLTYRLPESVLKKVRIKSAAIFLSGDNLLTFTSFPADPERLQQGQTVPGLDRSGNSRAAQYPQVRILSAGVNVKF